jgi:hypothetical protein
VRGWALFVVGPVRADRGGGASSDTTQIAIGIPGDVAAVEVAIGAIDGIAVAVIGQEAAHSAVGSVVVSPSRNSTLGSLTVVTLLISTDRTLYSRRCARTWAANHRAEPPAVEPTSTIVVGRSCPSPVASGLVGDHLNHAADSRVARTLDDLTFGFNGMVKFQRRQLGTKCSKGHGQ